MKHTKTKLKQVFSPKYRNLCKKRAEAGKLGGIKSGEVRRLKKAESLIEKDILALFPEIEIASKVLQHFEIDMEPMHLLKTYLRLRENF